MPGLNGCGCSGLGMLDPSWWTYDYSQGTNYGYTTDAFNPADPRNVAPGHTSMTVTATAPNWSPTSQPAPPKNDGLTDWLKKNQETVLYASIGLVTLALIAGRRR